MLKLSFMIVAAMVAVALPSAVEASDPTAPCHPSPEYANAGLAGAHEDVTPAFMPSWLDHETSGGYEDYSVVRFQYRIDVSGSPTKPFAQSADVRVTLGWDNPPSDYDLYVYDAAGQLVASSAKSPNLVGSEIAFIPEASHCTDLRVDIVNYIGLPGEMTLDTTIGSLE